MFRNLRNAFVSGLLLIAPVGVTVFVINLLIQKIGSPTRQTFFFFIPPSPAYAPWVEYGLHVAAVIVVAAIIALLGFLSKRLLGRMLLNLFERIVDSLPFVRTVYNTVKQIRDTFVEQEKAVFQKAVLIEYPRKGMYVLGFLTGEGKGEVQARTKADLLNIFVPTTPNPTSGFLLMVPREDVLLLDMAIGDAMKMIISGGAVVPQWPKAVEKRRLAAATGVESVPVGDHQPAGKN